MKPQLLWSLIDDPCYKELALELAELHENPFDAIGGERTNKAFKLVHSKARN